MKWLERLTRNQKSYAQARYERAKGGSDAVMTALDYPQRQLKKLAGGDDSEWFSPQGMPPELYAAGNTALDMIADPLNFVGLGLVNKGSKAVNAATGAMSGRGNATGAAKNYIDNFYNQEATKQQRVKSFGEWGADGVKRAVEQTIDPRQRALYREQGINSAMQDTARTALETGASRDTAKAVAQVQASGTLIPDQAGRVGPRAQAVKDLESRSFLTEPVPADKGAYTGLIKKNDLKGKYESGKTAPVSDKDLSIIDEHIGQVWKDRKGKPLKDSEGAHIRIKNAGAGDQVSGAHHADFIRKSGVTQTIGRLFKDGKNHSLEEMHKLITESSKVKIHPRSKTMKDVEENGLWVTGSFTGTAITEGGVNYIAKISPNGRVMAVVSDEHNFLEKLPVVGSALDSALPNRSVSVTPPMHFDLKKSKAKVKSEQPQNKANVKESLESIAKAEPSRGMLVAEQQKNAGAAVTATGLLTGGRKDEER